jgi:hypothetical protein
MVRGVEPSAKLSLEVGVVGVDVEHDIHGLGVAETTLLSHQRRDLFVHAVPRACANDKARERGWIGTPITQYPAKRRGPYF